MTRNFNDDFDSNNASMYSDNASIYSYEGESNIVNPHHERQLIHKNIIGISIFGFLCAIMIIGLIIMTYGIMDKFMILPDIISRIHNYVENNKQNYLAYFLLLPDEIINNML